MKQTLTWDVNTMTKVNDEWKKPDILQIYTHDVNVTTPSSSSGGLLDTAAVFILCKRESNVGDFQFLFREIVYK